MKSSAARAPGPRGSSGVPPGRSPRPANRNRLTPRGSEQASVLPLILSSASLSVGLGAAGVIVTSTPTSLLAWGLVGYLTAGFLPPLFLGWDSIAQRQGLKNPNFRLRRDYSRLLRFAVFAGIAVAIFHIWTVADVLAVAVSELLYVWGVLSL